MTKSSLGPPSQTDRLSGGDRKASLALKKGNRKMGARKKVPSMSIKHLPKGDVEVIHGWIPFPPPLLTTGANHARLLECVQLRLHLCGSPEPFTDGTGTPDPNPIHLVNWCL